MLLTKSKIYEMKLIVLEMKDKDFRDDYIKNSDQSYSGWGLIESSKKRHEKLIYYFIGRGASKWNESISWAIINRDKKLIDFLLERGAFIWYARITCSLQATPTSHSIKLFFDSLEN